MLKINNFHDAIEIAQKRFTDKTLMTRTWQGTQTKNRPDMAMHEVLHFSFMTKLPVEDLDYYRRDIKPNTPWVDDHFLERVSGHPLNPGLQWANWPYAKSADTFREKDGIFNHNYMERYWPRYAGRNTGGILQPEYNAENFCPREGIRGEYGDLDSLISLLVKDPHTRQAYLPIFFPEDTGDTNPGRKPCTLGYHFIHRGDYLDITYYIRSCDFLRHFRDDCFLTVRLLIWVLEKLREKDSYWQNIYIGDYLMHITSLHMFVNDYILLKKKNGL